MAVTIKQGAVEGHEAIEIETERLSLQVIPALGGKVAYLRDRGTQREFLWRHPDRALKTIPYGSNFEDGDISGWDECFPTIGEVVYPVEPWKGITVPDHGEVWTLPWHWHWNDGSLHMWCNSVRFAYRFERTFIFHDNDSGAGQVDVRYRVTNPTAFDLHAMWSMHPFYKVSAESRVLLPPDVRMRVEISTGARIGPFLAEVPWPVTTDHSTQKPIDLAVMGPAQATSEKLYTTPLAEGWAALFHANEEAFVAYTFDPQTIPFMGVCQIRGGWPASGAAMYSTLLEPCTGWPDRLDLALSRGAAMVVPANGSLEWQMSLHIGSGRSQLEQVIGRKLDYLLG